jgi:predicted Zn-dependent peptidase
MARQLLLFDRLIDTRELVARIDNVTPQAVRTLAAKLFTRARPSVVVVGAGRNGEHFASCAAERAAVA